MKIWKKLIEDLKADVENKTSIINKDAKYHKNQIKSLMDQLTQIKETWTPYEKKWSILII